MYIIIQHVLILVYCDVCVQLLREIGVVELLFVSDGAEFLNYTVARHPSPEVLITVNFMYEGGAINTLTSIQVGHYYDTITRSLCVILTPLYQCTGVTMCNIDTITRYQVTMCNINTLTRSLYVILTPLYQCTGVSLCVI